MTGGERMAIQGRINRLRVFSTVKKLMEETGQCPTSVEVAAVTGLAAQSAAVHMRALARADGLPFPIPCGKSRRDLAYQERGVTPELITHAVDQQIRINRSRMVWG